MTVHNLCIDDAESWREIAESFLDNDSESFEELFPILETSNQNTLREPLLNLV